MIASLRGTVASVTSSVAIIEVHGVGYSVRMTSKDLSTLHANQDVYVFTTMSVSQDAIALYGFLHKSTQGLFSQLQKVSGIGPKAALAILSTLTPDEFLHAIRENDVTALTKAPGVGKKGAQKIIVELAGSVNLDTITSDSDVINSSHNAVEKNDFIDSGANQVIQGLISLGWQQYDAVDAVKKALDDLEIVEPLSQAQIPLVLRHALTRLDRGR